MTVPKQATCATCGGNGAKPGTRPVVCPRCEGRGVDSQSQGFFSISQPCPQCGGRGEVIEEPCPTCQGSGLTVQRKRYRVNVPAGVHDGSRIRVAGKGEDGPARRPARRPLRRRPGRAVAGLRAAPDGNLEVRVPITIAGGGQRRHRRGPDAERNQADPRPGRAPSTARSSACAARARPSPDGAGGATSTTGSRSRSQGPLATSSERALDELAEALNGHDPRERILRRARDGDRRTRARTLTT